MINLLLGFSIWYFWDITTRKSINTNGNTDGIFSSVNFRGIFPTEIFPRYIPRELPWEKKIKTKQKKWWRVIFTDGINSIGNSVDKSVSKSVGKLWTLFIMSITKGITDGVFQNCSPSNCTVNCCSLRTKSPTDWKVVGVIWRFSKKN